MDEFIEDEGKLGQGFTSADLLEEIDLGNGDRPRPTFISSKLEPEYKCKLIRLLRNFKDCFAWEYYEMPGLDRSIVEHRLPIKPGYRPCQQRPRRCKDEMLPDIKAEITRLLEAKFIRQCRYAEWISSVVPVYKKNGKLRVCIDFRNLNKATPMDGYPMPVADMLVDASAGHKVISFMDGNAGYNQIFMAEEDISKTAFRCPGHIGLFEWVVMTFGLKNAGATYQRAMNYIFHKLIGKTVEIYIDDVVVKSGDYDEHLADLKEALECTRKYSLKMNPNKCAFGVSAGEFLGFMVHEKGIEIGKKSIDAINKVVAPTNKTELQSLIGKINFIRRFISNLSDKIQPFSALLKLKPDQEFMWGESQQKALEVIKQYLVSPPVLAPPQSGKTFKLYLSAGDHAIGSALVQEFEGKERVIYYVSRRLLDAETRYSSVEKLCLCLYFSCVKLRHYLLSAECIVVCKYDTVKHMLSMPIMNGRIGKWILALSEFDLRYESAKAVKGQVMADLVAQHCGTEIGMVEIVPWTLFFDGSSCKAGSGIGIILVAPQGATFEFSIPVEKGATNNQAEYRALLRGIRLLTEVDADAVEIFGDSQLVVNQLLGQYECKDDVLRIYYEECLRLLRGFKSVTIEHIPRHFNEEANKLAQNASSYRPICIVEFSADDWRKPIFEYLKDPSQKVDRKIRFQATKYVLLEDELYYKTIDGVLLKCLSKEESKIVMGEVHEGVCGAHQSAYKMKWVITRNGYFWPTMLEDCFKYFKGCQDCQRFGNIQRVPASAMNPIIKPWPFRGWGIDLIGQIYPPSSKNHKFILVATDYFTKWVEAIALKNVTSRDIIEFVREHIVYRFGIPQTITTDQGTMFTSGEFEAFANEMGIKLLNSSPYYAQANGQAEASNKGVIKLIKRKIEEKPRRWHITLHEALWAYRMACHGATKVSPYQLVYGHDAVLPWELKTGSRRITFQDRLTADEYNVLMKDGLEDLAGHRLRALVNIEANKARVARWYDKKAKIKEFQPGELVWKVVLPIGTKDAKFGKWSPTWEGPYRIGKCAPGNAYILETLEGEEFARALNGKYLKKYYPSIWVDA